MVLSTTFLCDCFFAFSQVVPATTGVADLSLCTYPCVISCPVSFCLFTVNVTFLLILLLVKSLFNEDVDMFSREPFIDGGKFLFCEYKCMSLLGMIRN